MKKDLLQPPSSSRPVADGMYYVETSRGRNYFLAHDGVLWLPAGKNPSPSWLLHTSGLMESGRRWFVRAADVIQRWPTLECAVQAFAAGFHLSVGEASDPGRNPNRQPGGAA